ncbi:MAG: class I SAM-dependent methyltransferase [Desulfobacteraceae bacterium]|jgi:SAM-dependent methyltransferase
MENLFSFLNQITTRPKPFEVYSAEMLWNDDYISKQLLGLHLDPSEGMVSRPITFIEQSVQWLVSSFNITSKTSIADIGCGPGLYANRLAQSGAKVTGIDISRRSIKYARQIARKKKLIVEYICQNYLEFTTLKKFDFIFMIFCDFCSLSPKQQHIILHKFHEYLVDDGRVILDVYTHNQFNQKKEYASYEHVLQEGFWSAEEYFGFLNTFKYNAEKIILDKYTLIEKNRVRTFYNWIQYFNTKGLFKLFEENGFKIESYYAGLTGIPYTDETKEIAVVARKTKAGSL